MSFTVSTVVILLVCFAGTVLAERFLIPKLRSLKMGQVILDIGPRWHKSKEGTPTMGGLGFIAVALLAGGGAFAYAAIAGYADEALPFFVTLLFAVFNGCIGILDDYTKLRHKRNEGLTWYQKTILQIALGGVYLATLRFFSLVDTTVYVPYADVTVDFGIAYYLLALVLIVWVVNCANLTDGIDGLASTVIAVIALFFIVAAKHDSSLPLSWLGAIGCGCALGFLVYNFYPARVFMGDTGSLFFGALALGGTIIIGNPLIVIVCGILYTVEGLSVVIQVACYKLFHRRVFKMAPIHHHFEQCGWSEIRIVCVFGAVTALACVGAYFGLC